MKRITADWLKSTASRSVCSVFADAGAEIFFVGGCVRNALMNLPVNDFDMATDVNVLDIVKLMKNAGVKCNSALIRYGVITVTSEQTTYQISTYRNPGRGELAKDAALRDFTMNALYADPDGNIIDPIGGFADIKARRVRFIGNASERIREDYLRSLRYFRFQTLYGNPRYGFDNTAIEAIAANLGGIADIRHGRIAMELMKLLAVPDPTPAITAMDNCGLLDQILPDAEIEQFAHLVELERNAGISPCPVRRLVALAPPDMEDYLLLEWKFVGKFELMQELLNSGQSLAELNSGHGSEIAISMALLRFAVLLQPWCDTELDDIRLGATAEFNP